MNKAQQKLFDSIMAEVPRQGWTMRAVEQGAKTAKMSPAEARRVFSEVESLIAAFHRSIDDGMLAALEAHRKFPALRVRDKIAFAVKARLQAMAGREEAVRRLLAWSAVPKHVPGALKRLWEAADLIWKEAGDVSDDYNRYTKRLLLCAVMKATLIFWLNDASDGHEATWAFLDRRIEDVMRLGKGAGYVLQLCGVRGSADALKAVGLADLASFARQAFSRKAA